MSDIILDAEKRSVQGKGASRRLRRLEGKIPAIVYGGTKKPALLNLWQNKVAKALEDEAIYSSIIAINVDGKKEQVLLKDLQRHPFRDDIIHMDFQRVSDKDEIVRMVPLHFVNDEASLGHQKGGVVNHAMTQVEIKCKAKDLPEFIEVDLINLDLDEVFHLSQLKLAKNVSLTADLSDSTHDLPVAGIHVSKSALAEEAQEAEELAEDVIAAEETTDTEDTDSAPASDDAADASSEEDNSKE